MKRDSITFKGKAANDAFMALSGKPPSSPYQAAVPVMAANAPKITVAAANHREADSTKDSDILLPALIFFCVTTVACSIFVLTIMVRRRNAKI